MTLAQNADVRKIFLEAVERGAADARSQFLDEACLGDATLRQRVENLLRAHVQPNSMLDGNGPVATISPSVNEGVGPLIGPYKLLEQIGEGGMGVVYMAQQTEPVKRKVALKVIKPGMDSKQVIARFEAERQALALMDHQHIARVLDAGTTDSGRPYFVMELVRGVSLTDYCDKQRLDTRDRLKLFLDVCHAVQHAHLKGIIHRDLKPSNVLVTLHDGTPVVKVIDFGVAKALNQELTEKTLFTQFSQMVGTPLYMSPEQAELSGIDIDTRSDVYSLGVLLYELLTGTTPFDKERLKSAGFDEMRRIIREEEPETVSQRLARTRRVGPGCDSSRRPTDSVAGGPALTGSLVPPYNELDWIVMKALEKDRSRRYESASALAADIQRYLSDEPVLACPPTTMYRFQKFARKHKPALATAAAIAVCLLLGTTVSAWQAVRATKAETQAETNEEKANANAAQAQEKAHEASAQRDEVKTLNEQLRRTLYASNMNLAQHAWKATGGVGRVRELLEQHRPKPGEADLRDFEWYYLNRLCHSELLTIKGATSSLGGGTMAFSPDGKRIATTWSEHENNTVKVFYAQTGRELLVIKGGGQSVAFSSDGMRLAAASTRSGAAEISVWDAESGQKVLTLQGHTGQYASLSFRPDGRHLATASFGWNEQNGRYDPGEMKVWDARTGDEVQTFKTSTQIVLGISYSPDGKRIAGQCEDAIRIWDAETGQELLSLKGGGGSVSFSRDGKRLASGRQVWDSETGKEQLALMPFATRVALSPDGKLLASCYSEQDIIKIRDSQTGDELYSLKGHTGVVTGVLFSPDGKTLVSRSRDGTIKIWDATTNPQVRTVSPEITRVRSVSFSPDGKRIAFATNGDRDAAKKAVVNSDVKICNVQTGETLLTLKGHTHRINIVAFSPTGGRLASGSSDQTVKVWDTDSGHELLSLKGHTAPVTDVVYSPDGKRLASCSTSDPTGIGRKGDPGEPGEVKIWNADTGAEMLTLKGYSRFVNSLAFSPDGKRLATLCRDQSVKVFDADSGNQIFAVKTFVGAGGCVAFSPDGKRLACSNNYTIVAESQAQGTREVKVLDAQTGSELLTLKGHSSLRINSVVFSPDGKRIISGTGMGPPAMGEIKVWDAQTGQELLTLEGHSELTHDVAISPDGRHLAARGYDGTLKTWDATPLSEKP